MSKTIFITGATGYVGRVIAEYALKEGYVVRALSRGVAGDEFLTAQGAVPVRGSLETFDVLSAEARNADVVFHLAFVHDFTRPLKELVPIDIKAVDAMAGAMVGTNKALVVTSGTGFIQADPEGKETDEESPAAPDGHFTVRVEAEKKALAWAEKGVRVSVIRLPQYVYGRGDRFWFAARWIKVAVENGVAGYLGDGEHRFSEVHVDDAARLYLLAAERADAGEVFNGVAGTETSYRQLAEVIGEVVGVPVRGFEREEVMEKWEPFLVAFASKSNRPSGAKAKAKLGWVVERPNLLSEIREGSYRELVEVFKE
ncbi:NAD(P)-binding protein [Aspergillus sclerotioniger CBS 115572]|uniref:NAD(P)-binding protein n=1 Tax=Aspergillus sclerotioniger CBS 115572 TaxID=1450535 RepID=A0A317WBD4_9EURO|nr:NAD(P)-binding protein [Aspergillus sclerotioniger CBS 115572]PWY83653.1 NAD(P)-binding protein [Aspergillus sclerotioniger CBS 115572]